MGEILMMMNEDGVFEEYNDEYDVTIHFESSEERDNYMKSQVLRWIPVEERLPKCAGTYLVTRYFPNNVMNPTYLVDACFFDGTDTWHNDNRINHERKYLTNIVAWLEEPEPYIVVEDKGSEE